LSRGRSMIRRPRIVGFDFPGSSAIGIGELTLLLSPLSGKLAPAAGLGGPRALAVSGSVGAGA
jgi:hypothetical protein